MFEKTTAVILAAGQKTRMKSALPKVLHPIAGRPLVHYPVRAALEAGCGEVVVVVGHGREAVESYEATEPETDEAEPVTLEEIHEAFQESEW